MGRERLGKSLILRLSSGPLVDSNEASMNGDLGCSQNTDERVSREPSLGAVYYAVLTMDGGRDLPIKVPLVAVPHSFPLSFSERLWSTYRGTSVVAGAGNAKTDETQRLSLKSLNPVRRVLEQRKALQSPELTSASNPSRRRIPLS